MSTLHRSSDRRRAMPATHTADDSECIDCGDPHNGPGARCRDCQREVDVARMDGPGRWDSRDWDHDYGGAYDGFSVFSDADCGL